MEKEERKILAKMEEIISKVIFFFFDQGIPTDMKETKDTN